MMLYSVQSMVLFHFRVDLEVWPKLKFRFMQHTNLLTVDTKQFLNKACSFIFLSSIILRRMDPVKILAQILLYRIFVYVYAICTYEL
jgi:hypothetical protein